MRYKKKTKRFLRWGPLYALLLTGYMTFALLDVFVIPQDILAAEVPAAVSQENITAEDGGTAGTVSGEVTVTGSSYESDRLTITIREETIHDTEVYIADVQVRDASLLQSGLANGSFGRNLKATTSEIAESCGAILAINGDFYGFRDTGYVLRNGQLYRDTPSGGEDLVLYQDGTMAIIDEDEVTAAELVEAGAVQIYSFGPGLVSDGSITVDTDYEVEQSMRSNPRTAIGQISEGHYVFVVSDGRTKESEGLTIYELAELLQDLGCETAYNLDGGGSSTMWFNGEIINHPTSGHGSHERSVSDIIYVA